ncbi:carbohydrate sulfotransferase 15-like [Liolophura sinensis]|uniref:carbohydrate sulfotransferase 15-like n=1 Tax=Liolophura sinensis TaxID=3198878 RepID=UPI0031595304
MMPGRVVTSPRTWYRNIVVCSRRQTFTTVTCLLVLTVCFTYFSLNKGWGVKLIPGKPLPGKSANLHERSRATIHKLGSKSIRNPTESKSSRESESVIIRENESDKDKYIAAIADALKLPNGNNMGRDSQPTTALTASEISNLGILPDDDKGQISAVNNTDSNSIEGSLILTSQKDGDDIRRLSKDQYQGNGGYYDENDGPSSVSDASSDYPVTTETVSQDKKDPVSEVQSDDIKSVLRDRIPPIPAVNSNSGKTFPDRPVLVRSAQPLTISVRSSNTVKATPSVSPKPSSPASYNLDEYDYDEHGVNSSWPPETIRTSGAKLMTMQEEIFYDPHEVDLLSIEPFKFLKDYKNPCWIENVTTWYIDNLYLEVPNVRAILTRMSATLRLRQETGDHHRVRCLPYFLIIGQPKCGSTDLYEKLTAHPDCVRPPTKEPHWWTRTRLGRHRAFGNVLSLADYVDLFDFAGYNIEQHPTVSPDTGTVYHKMITGEGSMSTFWDNDHWWAMVGNENTTEPRVLNPDYVHHVLPNAKLILILRNPTTRMYSDYLYFRKDDKMPVDFHGDVVKAIGVYENCFRQASIRSCAYNATVKSIAKVRLRVGMYSVFMKDWLRVFPREQFFIIRTEEYADNPRDVLQELYKFLGLGMLSDSHITKILSKKKANTRRVKDKLLGDMLPETRVLLNNFYRSFNEELVTLLRDDQFLWSEPGST